MSKKDRIASSLMDLGVNDYEMGFFNTFGLGKRSEFPGEVLEVVSDLKEVHPLIVRQVYYQCVVRKLVPSSDAGYKRVQAVLSKARKGGALAYSAIIDLHRTTKNYVNEDDESVREFIKRKKSGFLKSYFGGSYSVNLNEGAKYYIEVGLEKDALSTLATSACHKYQIVLNITKGQGSLSMAYEMAKRYMIAVKQGRIPIYIHFGDLDPSGVNIPRSLLANINRLMGDIKVELVMGGLTVEQVTELGIEDMDHIVKKTDNNWKKWIKEFGEDQKAYELDAINPLILPEFIDSKILPFIDLELRKENMKKAERKDEIVRRYKRRYYPDFGLEKKTDEVDDYDYDEDYDDY